MPSSLTAVLSSTLVYSTSPPVSVCGTGAHALARGFSWRYGLNPYGSGLPPPLTLPSQVKRRAGFAWHDSLPGWRSLRSQDLAPRVPPSLHPGKTPETDRARNGNLDPLSIAYGASPRLRPASPAADQHGCGTLGHSVGGDSHPPLATHADIRTPRRSTSAPASASRLTGTLPYHARRVVSHPRLRSRA